MVPTKLTFSMAVKPKFCYSLSYYPTALQLAYSNKHSAKYQSYLLLTFRLTCALKLHLSIFTVLTCTLLVAVLHHSPLSPISQALILLERCTYKELNTVFHDIPHLKMTHFEVFQGLKTVFQDYEIISNIL